MEIAGGDAVRIMQVRGPPPFVRISGAPFSVERTGAPSAHSLQQLFPVHPNPGDVGALGG